MPRSVKPKPVEQIQYRLWPGLRQLLALVQVEPELLPSRAALVPRRLKLVSSVQPLAVQRLSRLLLPEWVTIDQALRLLMQIQV